MSLHRSPGPLLKPFVAAIWVRLAPATNAVGVPPGIEHVLPSGAMHIAIRLDGEPLRLFDDDSLSGRDIGHGVLGGTRASFYAKASGGSRRTIGAQLRPGAARALFGVGASELAERHTRLDDLWGAAATELRERLQAEALPERQMDQLEAFLVARVPRVRGVHPAVAKALADFAGGAGIRDAVANSGYSHRLFIQLFDDDVGLTPKRHCRVLRLQSLLARAQSRPGMPWPELAHDAGYSDQSHFNRDFRQLAGVTPDAYRRLAVAHPHHVLIDAPVLPGGSDRA